jgi:hypothetical protein
MAPRFGRLCGAAAWIQICMPRLSALHHATAQALLMRTHSHIDHRPNLSLETNADFASLRRHRSALRSANQ